MLELRNHMCMRWTLELHALCISSASVTDSRHAWLLYGQSLNIRAQSNNNTCMSACDTCAMMVWSMGGVWFVKAALKTNLLHVK